MTFYPSKNRSSRFWLKHCHASSVKNSSSLFLWKASGNAIILDGPVRGQNWSFTGCDLWAVSPVCSELSHHQLLEKLPLKHLWKTCSHTGTVSCFVTNLSVPRRLLYLVCIVGVQWRSSFMFLSVGIPSNSSIALSCEWPQFLVVLVEDLPCNEFFVLWKAHHYSLLNQHGNLSWVWQRHVVKFRFHLFRRKHLQKGLWLLPRMCL